MNGTSQVKRTGMIGLGAMGLQMGRHMVRKGFDVAGYDIDTDAMRRAESHGVKKCGSPSEVGKHAEIVIVMVATDAQVESAFERILRAAAGIDILVNNVWEGRWSRAAADSS